MGLFVNTSPPLQDPLLWSEERIFLIPPKGTMTFDNHEFKIIYFFRAEGDLAVDNGTAFTIKNDDLVLIPGPCRQVYSNPHKNNPIQIHAFRINMCYREELANDHSPRAEFIKNNFHEVIHCSAGHSPDLIETLHRIRRELEERSLGWELSLDTAAWQFLITSARIFQGGTPDAGKALSPRLQLVYKAREYIHKNYHRPITLGDIALHVDRGEEHLAREFKKSVGLTVFQYLRKTRIDAAVSLMTDSSYSLSQIAQLTGFGSLPFFSHCFRKAMGKPPSEYRATIELDITSYKPEASTKAIDGFRYNDDKIQRMPTDIRNRYLRQRHGMRTNPNNKEKPKS